MDSEDVDHYEIRNVRRALPDQLIPHYQRKMEQGGLLPDRVVVSSQSNVKFDHETCFDGQDFWFPILWE